MTGLTIDERGAICLALQQFAQQAADVPVLFPDECPLHPGEQDFDQDWIRRLVQIRIPLEMFGTAMLAASPEIIRQHLQRSVHILEARGIAPEPLHRMLERLEQTVAGGLPNAGNAMMAELITAAHIWIDEAQGMVPAPFVTPSPHRQYLFFQAMLAGRRPDSLSIVNEALDDGQPVMSICTDLFQTGLYEVGRLWELHRIHVGQEHMATAVAQLAFSQLALRAGPHPDFRPRGHAVVMGMQGEFHQFPGQIVAALLEARGWEISYWGTALPASTILVSLRQRKPRLLCISLTLPDSLPKLYELLRQIRGDEELRAMRILAGGQAFENAPEAGRDLGADASTPSLQQGLEWIDAWGL